MTCWRGECQRGCYYPDACNEGDEQPEAIREAFALGAAWALGDDEEAPAALRAEVERLSAERDRYRAAWKSAATRAGIAADRAEAIAINYAEFQWNAEQMARRAGKADLEMALVMHRVQLERADGWQTQAEALRASVEALIDEAEGPHGNYSVRTYELRALLAGDAQ